MSTEMATMENLMYDDEGVETCIAIEPKSYIELRLCGYKASVGDRFVDHFENIGCEKTASGIYPDGARWYRFKIKGE